MIEQDVFTSSRQPNDIVTTVHNVNNIILVEKIAPFFVIAKLVI